MAYSWNITSGRLIQYFDLKNVFGPNNLALKLFSKANTVCWTAQLVTCPNTENERAFVSCDIDLENHLEDVDRPDTELLTKAQEIAFTEMAESMHELSVFLKGYGGDCNV